jgi:amino acid transporter
MQTVLSSFKRLVVGRPIATSEEGHQRLTKVVALAVLASDAISSTAYATEEILHVLVPVAAMGALDYLIPISLVVMVLLVIVITSYSQTIHAYPSGGGSYVVSKENLGETPALVAGSSLLTDYVLTVAVSISAGVAAITSAFEGLAPYRVEMCLAGIALLAFANLRGLKESGRVFAGPTYLYVSVMGALIVYGLYRTVFGGLDPLPVNEEALHEITGEGVVLSGVTAFALARAFSSGAVALTGIEAISNGVPAFRKPESRNASITLVWMGLILATYFFGISVLAHRLQPTLSEDVTILSILARTVFGGGPLFFTLQAATALILFMAANTAYADFPRVASILAKDGYLPRQLGNRGDRLVFSNGILVLSAVAALLIVVFGGITTALIPLYAVGVFCGFTLSQLGMVKHHRDLKEPGWQRNAVINGIGALATFLVLMIVVVSKFTIGAWVPVVVIPMIVVLLKSVNRHYKRVASLLEVPDSYRAQRHTHTVVVLVGQVHQGVLAALTYAESLHPDRLIALSVATEDGHARQIQDAWERHGLNVRLEVIHSPYRDLTQPVLRYLDELDAAHEDDIITVVLPEFVLDKWWEQLLHNQSALGLKARLLFRRNTVVISVPFHLSGRTLGSSMSDDGEAAFNEAVDEEGDPVEEGAGPRR